MTSEEEIYDTLCKELSQIMLAALRQTVELQKDTEKKTKEINEAKKRQPKTNKSWFSNIFSDGSDKKTELENQITTVETTTDIKQKYDLQVKIMAKCISDLKQIQKHVEEKQKAANKLLECEKKLQIHLNDQKEKSKEIENEIKSVDEKIQSSHYNIENVKAKLDKAIKKKSSTNFRISKELESINAKESEEHKQYISNLQKNTEKVRQRIEEMRLSLEKDKEDNARKNGEDDEDDDDDDDDDSYVESDDSDSENEYQKGRESVAVRVKETSSKKQQRKEEKEKSFWEEVKAYRDDNLDSDDE